jgi:hypothetical protein
MDRIQRLFQAQAQAQGGGGPAADAPVVDTAELVYISSMARTGRAILAQFSAQFCAIL